MRVKTCTKQHCQTMVQDYMVGTEIREPWLENNEEEKVFLDKGHGRRVHIMICLTPFNFSLFLCCGKWKCLLFILTPSHLCIIIKIDQGEGTFLYIIFFPVWAKKCTFVKQNTHKGKKKSLLRAVFSLQVVLFIMQLTIEWQKIKNRSVTYMILLIPPD